jgi:protein-S-isoprenylcysteine O-methyltransferase Ste14
MGRMLALLYGIVCYGVFFAVFLYAIWFVWTMDRPASQTSLTQALLIDTGLLLLFAVQHSGMARQGFKRAWIRVVPQPIERSTYVLASSLALLVLCFFWQPIPTVIWQVDLPAVRYLLYGLFWLGWALVFASTFLIDHFDLFGLKQVVRFLIAFWSAPRMTLGHLYFAGVTTAWILLAIQFEERDLVDYHGEKYKVYRSGVSMLVPWPGKKHQP